METNRPRHKSFSERLRYLFEVVRHPSGREYSATEVAEAINASGRHSNISRGYISAMKEGHRSIPGPDYAEALAEFFGVPASYFLDDETAAWVEKEIELVLALRDSPVRHISLQAYGLSPASLQVIAETVKHLRHVEGLPAESEGPAPRRRRRGKRHESNGTGPSEGATASGS